MTFALPGLLAPQTVNCCCWGISTLISEPCNQAGGDHCGFPQQHQRCRHIAQVHSTQRETTGPRGKMDLAAAEGGRWYTSQPDNVMAREGDTRAFWNVAFQRLRFHDLDHRVAVATILRGQKGRLKKYRQSCQKFPLQLPPLELQDEDTKIFGELRGECKEKDPASCPWNDWISKESWQLIANRAMLRRSSHLYQRGGCCLH